MKKSPIFVLAAVLTVLAFWLQREFLRGTFDPVERRFVAWLAANAGQVPALPPLTVVLYDTEASELAGASRMAVQDAALFARAAAKLGAAAAGVEGLAGNPSRILDAAGRMPLFGGFSAENPPGNGWSAWEGMVDSRWPELPGAAVSGPARFPRGFFAAPAGGSGPRRLGFLARSGGHPVPSFLALACAAGGGARVPAIRAAPGGVAVHGRFVPVDGSGAAWFFPDDTARVISMNELLVAAEKFERQGGVSPLRGRVLVLGRATPDVARFKTANDETATPAELWARSWQALRRGTFFVPPGWWYPPVLAVAALLLGAVCRSGRGSGAAVKGLAALLMFLLVALAAFQSSGLLLPLVPSAATLAAGLLLARFIARRREPGSP